MKPDDIKQWYSIWCKATKRNGSVLVGKSIQQLLNDFCSHPIETNYSPKYLKWVKDNGQKNLTSAQHIFAEWCFMNEKIISQIGNIEDVFIKINHYLKSQTSH